jgi:multiple sugar transport system substrate-binding protein
MPKSHSGPQVNRRDLIKLTVGGATVLWLGGAGLAQAAAPTTIKAGWYGGQDTHDRMKKAIGIFMQKNPDINVTTEYAAFADFYDRLPVEYSAGTAPDVHRHSMTYLFDYIKRGLLSDMAPYVGKVIDTSGLYPGVVEIGKDGDQVHAIGNNQIARAIFYDKAKVDTLGANVLDNMTWQKFHDIASELGKKGGANHYGTSDDGGDIAALELFITQRGKSLYKDESSLGFDASDLADWFQFWQSMRDDQGAPPPSVTAESAGFQNAPMVKGLAAMQGGWIQQLVFFQQLMKAEVNAHTSPIPAGAKDNGHLIRALDFWVIPQSSQHKEEAAKLVNFLLNDPDAITTLNLTLGGPQSQKAADILAKSADAPGKKILDYLAAIRPNAPKVQPRWIPGHGQLAELLTRSNASVGFGQSKPADAAKSLVDQAASILG